MRARIGGLRGGLALVVVAACGAAAGQAAGFGPKLTQSIGAAPAARVIVFSGVRWSSCCATSRIYLIRADGTGMRRITDVRNVEDVDPVWRPDGQRIAFARRDARGWRLYVMTPEGRQFHAISPLLGDVRAPAWSPDGRRLAFEWMPLHPPLRGSFSQQIAVINANGTGLRVVTRNATFKGGTARPAWSPDGKTILFAGRTSLAEGAGGGLWSIRPNGGGVRRLIPDASDPAWSPDGRMLAFSRRGDLYVATSSGRIVRRLTRGSYADSTMPTWSPDGTHLVYATTHYDKQAQPQSECLTVIDADGRHRHEITGRDPDFWATSPAWRPVG